MTPTLLFMLGGLAAAPAPALPEEMALPPGSTLSVDDAVLLALQRNFTLRAAELGRTPQRFAVEVAKNRFAPRYNANASAGRVWGGGEPAGQRATGETLAVSPHAELLLPTGTQLTVDLTEAFTRPPTDYAKTLNSTLTLAISQPLLRDRGPRVNLAGVAVAELQNELGRLQLKNTLIQNIYAVILAYRTFWQAGIQLEIAQKALARSRELRAINLELVDAGRMARADLIIVESEIATREANQVNAEGNYIDTQIALMNLLALTADASLIAVREAVPALPPLQRDELLATALAHRPDLLGQRVSRLAAEQNLILAHNARLWDLRLTAQHQRGGTAASFGRVNADVALGPSHATFFGLALSVPLVDIALQQQIVASEVAVGVAQIGMEQIYNNVSLDVDDALRTLHLRRRIYDLSHRARELTERKLANEREKLSVGRSSNFQVLRFVDDLVNAESAELFGTVGYLNALTALEVRCGTLLDRWDVAALN